MSKGKTAMFNDPLCTRALHRQPLGDQVPQSEGGIVWELFKEKARIVGGFGYLDGSCDTSVVREARRGGWGIALFSREGEKRSNSQRTNLAPTSPDAPSG